MVLMSVAVVMSDTKATAFVLVHTRYRGLRFLAYCWLIGNERMNYYRSWRSHPIVATIATINQQ